MKYIYVAGAITPYPTEPPVIGFLANIRRGIRATVELLLNGYIPFCPFLDHQFFMQLRNGENITGKMIKDYSMAWLEKCDAILVLSRWRKSEGTKAEIARAKEIGIPIFYSMDDLFDHESEKEE